LQPAAFASNLPAGRKKAAIQMKMKLSRAFLPLVCALCAVAAAWPARAADAPPQVTASELSQPLPKPYDASANAPADVDAALARAKVSGKRVLLDLGGNWCPDCRFLAGVLDIPEVKAFIGRHFETVYVDVGHFDKNLDIPARFGAPKPKGVPTVLVLNADGTLVDTDQREDLSDARSMTPQAVVDWLARWAASK
jgi:thiol-disulfide isomerase/thioredoxin